MQEHHPFLVEDADVHGPRVQIDPAVVLVRLRVESHRSLLLRRCWLVYSPFVASTPRRARAGGGLNEYQGDEGIREMASVLEEGDGRE